MTDTTIESTDTHDTDASMAEYEAQRSTQDVAEVEVPEAGGEEAPAEEGPLDPVAHELEKARASLKDRSNAARRERLARVAAEERASALEARLAALEGKSSEDPLAQLREDDADPIGDLEAIKRHFRQNQQQQAQTQAQQQQQAAQQREIQTLTNYAAPFEEDFKAENPDYDEASRHLYQSRMEDLTATYGPERAQQVLTQELLALIATAKAQNADPAAIVYDLAKKRGFTGKVSIDNASQPIQTIKRGQQAARTVGGGRAESSEMSYEAVMALPASQREAAFEKLRAQEQRREMMG